MVLGIEMPGPLASRATMVEIGIERACEHISFKFRESKDKLYPLGFIVEKINILHELLHTDPCVFYCILQVILVIHRQLFFEDVVGSCTETESESEIGCDC